MRSAIARFLSRGLDMDDARQKRPPVHFARSCGLFRDEDSLLDSVFLHHLSNIGLDAGTETGSHEVGVTFPLWGGARVSYARDQNYGQAAVVWGAEVGQSDYRPVMRCYISSFSLSEGIVFQTGHRFSNPTSGPAECAVCSSRLMTARTLR